MAKAKIPPPPELTEDANFSSYTTWKNSALLYLNSIEKYGTFISGSNAKWAKKTSSNPTRDFRNDVETGTTNVIYSAASKVNDLEEMLGIIARYVPVFIQSEIVKSTTCLDDVWMQVRKYFGIRRSEANFLKYLAIVWEDGERPERLLCRMMSHINDNLLLKEGKLKHDGVIPPADEDISPTTERLVVARWLELLHPRLPALVMRTFSYDVQNMTVKDLQPQIIDALDGLLEELRSEDSSEAKVSYVSTPNTFKPRQSSQPWQPQGRGRPRHQFPRQRSSSRSRSFSNRQQSSQPSCRVCLAEGRPHRHSMSDCRYISQAEKSDLARSYYHKADVRNLELYHDDEETFSAPEEEDEDFCRQVELVEPNPLSVGLVSIESSPIFTAYIGHTPVDITCDSGATSSFIRLDVAKKCNMKIRKASQKASQADGAASLSICGEVSVQLTRGKMKLQLDALVADKLNADVLGGVPFLRSNKMVLDIPDDRILVDGGRYTIPTLSGERTPTSQTIRAECQLVIMPGDSAEFKNPVQQDVVAIEPHNPTSIRGMWPQPQIITATNGSICIPNDTDRPIVISKHQHVAIVRAVVTQPQQSYMADSQASTINVAKSKFVKPETGPYSLNVIIDPNDKLSIPQKEDFATLNLKYDAAYDPKIGRYNDASGKLRASVNIGPVKPPVCKGRQPSYNTPTLCELQDHMDDLEDVGVLAKPEDVKVEVEYVSPSFLVKKLDGTKRTVTAFNGLAAYCRPPPSRVTCCNSVLRFLAKHKCIIKTDMTKQFHQMLVSWSSMKYLGVQTPYKGTRVYTRAAMGMPGSTEHLDELMQRVLGDLMHEGLVAKIADDLYVGADSHEPLLQIWEEVLRRFCENNLRLSAKKTVICPSSCTVLGWLWTEGAITPSPHKLNPLTTATQPVTVKGLRSWLGAAKHMKSCVPSYSSLFSPLETAVGGKESRQHVDWTDSLKSAFRKAQDGLRQVRTIEIPRPSDQLVITTDGACVNGGIGAVLYVVRDGNKKLGGFFSMKLKPHQQKWLPCEVEALGIASAISHWSMYLTESSKTTQILSDSKPCIQAFAKLRRGEFSSSARVATFLSTLSRYRVELQHISGASNLTADYLSRNASTCENEHCQVCKFVECQDVASVAHVSVSDVLNRKVTMPFTNPLAWKKSQQDCPDLRKTFAILHQGTKPHRKNTKKDIKRYYNVTTINTDGLLVVKRNIPFMPNRSVTVVPRHMLSGLLTALHIRFNHPTKTQLQKVFDRHFYALDSEEAIKTVTESCAQCLALSNIPLDRPEFSTSPPATSPGVKFSSDVLRRASQKILVTRDTFSSYTTACFIPKEDRDSFRSGLLATTSDLRIGDGAVVRVDADSALKSLVEDPVLQQNGLIIEIGRVKNPNKNPIAEKAIQELEQELKRRHPEGRILTSQELSVAIHELNARHRNRGLSAREIVFQREYMTGNQLTLNDADLAEQQHELRTGNHMPSAKSKVPKANGNFRPKFKPGDLIFVKTDGSKHVSRDKYIVSTVDASGDYVYARKFTSGSQFRSQVYKLKHSEVVRVPHSLPDPPVSGRPISISSLSTDDDSDVEINNPLNRTHKFRPFDMPRVSSDSSEHSDKERSDPELRTNCDIDQNVLLPEPQATRSPDAQIYPTRVFQSTRGRGRRQRNANNVPPPPTEVLPLTRSRTKPKWMTSGEYVLDY